MSDVGTFQDDATELDNLAPSNKIGISIDEPMTWLSIQYLKGRDRKLYWSPT